MHRARRITALFAAGGFTAALMSGPAVLAAPPSDPAPAPGYTWTNAEIVGGGFVPGLVYNETEPGLAYARTDIGGAYRWDEGLERWKPLMDFVGWDDWNLTGIEALASDPVDPDNLYVLAGTYTGAWASNAALFRSGDRGDTFDRVDLPFRAGGNENGRSMGERLMVDPDDNNNLYLGTRNDGLWLSTDAGRTWSRNDPFPRLGDAGIGISFIEFGLPTPGAPTEVYVGAADKAGGIFKSKDGGQSWQQLPGQPVGFYAHHGRLAPDGFFYVTYGDLPGPYEMHDGGVWRFDPSGMAWKDITPLRPNTGTEGGFGYAGLAVDASRPGTVMAATMGRWGPVDDIFRSVDGGENWTSITEKKVMDTSASPFLNWHGEPKLGWMIGALEIDPFNSDRVLFGTGATIFGTDNATDAEDGGSTTWSVRAQGLEETAVLDLASPTWGDAPLYSALGDIGTYRHDNLSEVPANGMDPNPIFGTSTSIEYAPLREGFLVRSGWGEKRGAYTLDGGDTWQPFPGEPVGITEPGHVSPSADGSAVVWSTSGMHAFRTTDLGNSWTQVQGLPNGLEVVADRADAALFFAFDPATGTAYASNDGGATFSATQTGLPSGSGVLEPVTDRAGNVWLSAAGGGLWRSTDAGISYQQVLSGVGSADQVAFGKAAKGASHMAVYLNGVVGGTRGIFRSDDAGASWLRINDDAHQWGWTGACLAADPDQYGRVFICTNGRGIQVGELTASPKPGKGKEDNKDKKDKPGKPAYSVHSNPED